MVAFSTEMEQLDGGVGFGEDDSSVEFPSWAESRACGDLDLSYVRGRSGVQGSTA